MAKKKKKLRRAIEIIVSVLLVVMLLATTAWLLADSMLGKVEYVDPASDDFIVSWIPDDSDESQASGPTTSSDVLASYDVIASTDLASRLPVVSSTDKVTNVLLIGTDSRGLDFRGRTDSMILVTINETRKTILLTSIMRDIYAYIPSVAVYNRINTAYAYGGESLLIKTLKQNFGLSVDRYITVNFNIFTDFIDALDGIDLNFTESEYNASYELVFKDKLRLGLMTEEEAEAIKNGSTFHASGADALVYARIRYSAGGDFRRTERQRKVIMKVMNKLSALPITDFISLLNEYLGKVRTTFSKNELMTYILTFATYMNYDIESWRIPQDGTWQNLNVGGRSMIGIDFSENLKLWNKKVYG